MMTKTEWLSAKLFQPYYLSQKINSELFETDGRAHTVTPGAPVGAKNERSSSHYVRYQPYVQQEILFFWV